MIAPPGETLAALAPLPPCALALEEVALERLAAVGVDSIAQLVSLPRAALPVRLGEAVLERLDRALGRRADVLVAERFPELVRERFEMDGGCEALETLALALEDLARRALARLSRCSLAAKGIEVEFVREDARPVRSEVRLAAPISQLGPLMGVLRERLERVDLSRPVVAIELRVPETARVELRQGDLFAARDGSESREDLACLIARLEGRLGTRNVLRPELVSEHRPERTVEWRPANEKILTGTPCPAKRPTRLLARPIPIDVACGLAPTRFALQGVNHAVLDATGPERIETGFWDGDEVRRDYWIVADEAWRRSWIFRELDSGQWYLHGWFD